MAICLANPWKKSRAEELR